MPDLTQLALFLAAATVLAVTPGPGIFYVAARTLAGGRAESIASGLGTGLGGLLQVMAGALGVSAQPEDRRLLPRLHSAVRLRATRLGPGFLTAQLALARQAEFPDGLEADQADRHRAAVSALDRLRFEPPRPAQLPHDQANLRMIVIAEGRTVGRDALLVGCLGEDEGFELGH
jgi:hypothetical protein